MEGGNIFWCQYSPLFFAYRYMASYKDSRFLYLYAPGSRGQVKAIFNGNTSRLATNNILMLEGALMSSYVFIIRFFS